jgi:CP family cyanate transporter-like MFS transporter
MFRLSLGVALPEIQAAYLMSDVEAGLMVSVGSISIMVFILYGGYLTDRLGVFSSFLLGIFLFSLGLVLFMFAWNFWVLTVFIFLTGVGSGILIPTVYSWVGEVSAARRGLGIGITNALFGVGGFLGSWLTGSLLKEGYYWVLPFHIFAFIGFTSAVVCLVFRGSLRTRERRPRQISRGSSGYGFLLHSRSLLLLFFGMLASNVAYFNFIVWVPSFLLRLQGFSIAEGGIALAVFSLVGSGGAVSFGYLYGKVKRSFLASALGFASALTVLPIIVLSYSVEAGLLFFAVFGFLLFPYWNLQITMAQESVGEDAVGRATGLVQSAGLLSSVVGPFLAGLLIEQAGMVMALLTTVFFPLLAYAVIVLNWKPGSL